MAAATVPIGFEVAGDRRQLEEDFLELLIASERVGNLVDVIKDTSKFHRRKQAVRELAQAVQSRETFAVEARIAGAVDVLTSLINLYPGEEELTEDAARIITVCSGTLACGGKVHELRFGKLTVHLREGSLADGLGARMWAISRSLSSILVDRPALVSGLEVLEIGAGTGLCGIVAAKLGASQVVVTDCEEAVLLNLRECAAANAAPAQGNGHAPQGAFPSQAAEEDLDFDPEDADECDDLSDFLAEAASAKNSATGRPKDKQALQWDLDNMRVRFMDWGSDLDRLQRGSGAAETHDSPAQQPEWLGTIPQIQDSATFDVILGSDILYEEQHARMVAAVLKLRLRPDGVALIALAIRDEAIYAKFLEQLNAQQFTAEVKDVEPVQDSQGIMGHARDYHGFVVLMIMHASKGSS